MYPLKRTLCIQGANVCMAHPGNTNIIPFDDVKHMASSRNVRSASVRRNGRADAAVGEAMPSAREDGRSSARYAASGDYGVSARTGVSSSYGASSSSFSSRVSTGRSTDIHLAGVLARPTSATRARTARSRTYLGLLPALVSTRPCARSPQMTSLLRAPLSRRMKRRAVNARRGLLPIGERLARNSEPRKCSRASLAPMIAIGRKRLGLRYIRPRWAKATRERSRTSAARRLRANARRLPLKGRRHRASSPPVLQSSAIASLHCHGLGFSVSHDQAVLSRA